MQEDLSCIPVIGPTINQDDKWSFLILHAACESRLWKCTDLQHWIENVNDRGCYMVIAKATL